MKKIFLSFLLLFLFPNSCINFYDYTPDHYMIPFTNNTASTVCVEWTSWPKSAAYRYIRLYGKSGSSYEEAIVPSGHRSETAIILRPRNTFEDSYFGYHDTLHVLIINEAQLIAFKKGYIDMLSIPYYGYTLDDLENIDWSIQYPDSIQEINKQVLFIKLEDL